MGLFTLHRIDSDFAWLSFKFEIKKKNYIIQRERIHSICVPERSVIRLRLLERGIHCCSKLCQDKKRTDSSAFDIDSFFILK